MRVCKICGSENEDGALRCSGCGIGFTEEEELRRSQLEVVNPQTQRLKFLVRIVPKFVASILVIAIAVFADRAGVEKLRAKYVPLFVGIQGTRQQRGEFNVNGKTVFRREFLGGGTRYNPVESREEDAEEKIALDEAGNVQRMPPYDLGREFSDLNNWRIDWPEFLNRHPNIRFRNDGPNRHSVLKEYVLFHGYSLCDDTFVFSEDALETIDFSLFNMGDEKTLADEAAALEVINAISEVVAADRVDESLASDGNGKFVVNYDWVGSAPHLTMMMGVVSRQGVRYVEYLNGTLAVAEHRVVVNASGNPRLNVRRSQSDVYIDGVPMVNQGQRGYCFPATIERILRYYGVDADMHALALILDTKIEGGTRINTKQIEKIAQMAGLHHEEYRDLECYNDEYFARYNMAARDYGGKQLFIEDFTVEETTEDGSTVNMRHYDWMSNAMDQEIKRKSRLYDTEGFAKFRNGIMSCIEKGHPLVWSVDRLFTWDRSDGFQGDGHIRIIVGYNELHDEVLYSDSWGSGHEFKRAKMKDAWESTDFLTCLFQL